MTAQQRQQQQQRQGAQQQQQRQGAQQQQQRQGAQQQQQQGGDQAGDGFVNTTGPWQSMQNLGFVDLSDNQFTGGLT
jgi:hypothetical protein